MASQVSANQVREIIREEIAGSKDIAEIKAEQKNQGVLLEELNSKFDNNIDLLTKQMNVKKQIDNHEDRIGELEAGQKTIKSVVKLHSKQLAAK